MRARVNTQTRQSLPCSHTQSISSKRLEDLIRHTWVLNISRHVDFKTKKCLEFGIKYHHINIG